MGTVTQVHKESATLRFSDGTTHTFKDPSLHRNEKKYTFQNPAISIRPRLTGRHELLPPPPFPTPKSTSRPPSPPGQHAGFLIGSSLHGKLYRLPDEPHSLNPDDVEDWSCASGLAFLHTAPPHSTWVYLDCSAGPLGYGSAATLFSPTGT